MDNVGSTTLLNPDIESGVGMLFNVAENLKQYRAAQHISQHCTRLIIFCRVEKLKSSETIMPGSSRVNRRFSSSFHYFAFFSLQLKQVLKKVLNVRYNKELFKKIWDNTTHNNPSYYERFNETVRDEGSTSHLSVIAANGDTVSVTGSVNY